MRCCACNKNLNDFESTLKHADTGEYLDMCNKCLSFTGIPVAGRNDLEPSEQIDMEDDLGETDWEDYDDE